ncbi:REP-associated tyrosine transposase [Novilysobacter spongiicola]|uniref:REP element-mobilizing transposase RayT n=1 Tax=Lysobacter spongiicola DSM 21749 TaxID=1122188 RepID=A0A1T4RJ74_9GAMM|nr:transposase [Lysobacter spongiicola]SKA15937.1 REP element-mobilizing transposase RayT [Lysobacter spongiicola DSM 21749]
MGHLSPIRRGHAALRRGRTSLPNQVYLVTFTTHLRQSVFTDDACACAMSRAVTDPRLWPSSELLAWVLMPDHWHGLLALGERDYLPSLVQRVKTNTARHVRQVDPTIERVWSKAYHDRALRAEDDIVVAARYVVMNPVRAGLVQRVGQYPYWNAIWL